MFHYRISIDEVSLQTRILDLGLVIPRIFKITIKTPKKYSKNYWKKGLRLKFHCLKVVTKEIEFVVNYDSLGRSKIHEDNKEVNKLKWTKMGKNMEMLTYEIPL